MTDKVMESEDRFEVLRRRVDELELTAAETALKSQALRILGLGFFQAGPTRNVDKGRQRMAEALDALNADSSPTATHHKAMLRDVGNHGGAQRLPSRFEAEARPGGEVLLRSSGRVSL